MKVRFLADANFNQNIVAGLLLRAPGIDFALPQAMIPERMKDPDVLDLARLSGRVVVSHDVTTMPRWFGQCVEERSCAGLVLIPEGLPIRDAIEDLLICTFLAFVIEAGNVKHSGMRARRNGITIGHAKLSATLKEGSNGDTATGCWKHGSY